MLLAALPSHEVVHCRPLDTEGASDTISITQIRDILTSLSLAIPKGHTRVIWIEPAEGLTKEAANALLKKLEEPPPGILFFLFAKSTKTLLGTIVSRCLLVRFPITARRHPIELPHLHDFLSHDMTSQLQYASSIKKEEIPSFENLILDRIEHATTKAEFEHVVHLYNGICASYGAVRSHMTDQACVDLIYL